jgi:hypothetical protein
MESTHQQAPLTSEQLAAMNAGGGTARLEDPQTHIVYTLTCEPAEREYDDDYIREKLAEGYADFEAGRYAEWNLEEMKAELAQRLAKKQSKQ